MQMAKHSQGNIKETQKHWRPPTTRHPDIYIATITKANWCKQKERLTLKVTEKSRQEESLENLSPAEPL